LAELLGGGLVRSVYHGENGLRTLRELARSYQTISKDLKRVMNRLKALFRGWGIACAGVQVYDPRYREEWLNKIPQAGVRRRAELFYQHLDGLQVLRRTVRGEFLIESRKHLAAKLLAPDSVYRSDSDCAIDCADPNSASLPQQAAALDVPWLGDYDARQCRILLCRRRTPPFQETPAVAGAESKSQPRDEGDFQECSHQCQPLYGTVPRFLRCFAGQGHEARDGWSDAGAQDRGHYVDTVEERRTFRR
jgi:hypothetical protein